MGSAGISAGTSCFADVRGDAVDATCVAVCDDDDADVENEDEEDVAIEDMAAAVAATAFGEGPDLRLRLGAWPTSCSALASRRTTPVRGGIPACASAAPYKLPSDADDENELLGAMSRR